MLKSKLIQIITFDKSFKRKHSIYRRINEHFIVYKLRTNEIKCHAFVTLHMTCINAHCVKISTNDKVQVINVICVCILHKYNLLMISIVDSASVFDS